MSGERATIHLISKLQTIISSQGDSGGPLILKVDRDITYSYVVGITSFGQACGGAPPSIYSRVSAYIDWIEDIVWPIAQLSGFGVNG